jgi:hypothetical protein
MSVSPSPNAAFSSSTDKLGKHDTEMLELPSAGAVDSDTPQVDRFGTVVELDEAQRVLRRKIDLRISKSQSVRPC